MGIIQDKINLIKNSKIQIKNAIVYKGGDTPGSLTTYANSIRTIPTDDNSEVKIYTGHADTVGLKSIGWSDEDIEYYSKYGVNWNEEDDEYHKVPEDNISLYGILTPNNIETYKDKIVYLPKIDTGNVTSMGSMFENCYSLVAIPQLNTANVTDMSGMFGNCSSLVVIPQLNTANVTNMCSMFGYCCSLKHVPILDTTNVTDMSYMFSNCHSISVIPQLNFSSINNISNMFEYCYSLTSSPQIIISEGATIDKSSVSCEGVFDRCTSLVSIDDVFCELGWPTLSNGGSTYGGIGKTTYDLNKCFNLRNCKLYGINSDLYLNDCPFLSKESLLFIIENSFKYTVSYSNIYIHLNKNTYDKYAGNNDYDIKTALAKHKWVSLSRG